MVEMIMVMMIDRKVPPERIIGCQLLVSPSSARERVLTPIATGKAIDLDEHGVRNPKVTWADLRQFRRTGLAGSPRSQLWNYAWSFPRSYTHVEWQFTSYLGVAYNSWAGVVF